jgi:hypothetical protein
MSNRPYLSGASLVPVPITSRPLHRPRIRHLETPGSVSKLPQSSLFFLGLKGMPPLPSLSRCAFSCYWHLSSRELRHCLDCWIRTGLGGCASTCNNTLGPIEKITIARSQSCPSVNAHCRLVSLQCLSPPDMTSSPLYHAEPHALNGVTRSECSPDQDNNDINDINDIKKMNCMVE